MKLKDFIELYSKDMDSFIRMSSILATRSDYTQGSGGNSSVKLNDEWMAIKASGYNMNSIGTHSGYVIINYRKISEWFYLTELNCFSDIEKAGTENVRLNIIPIDGMDVLRPSVEVGFHALLRKYVIHTHPVYANCIMCSSIEDKTLDEILDGIDCSWVVIPEMNPGIKITFAIKDALDSAENKTGIRPKIIFLRNHGMIVTDDDANECMHIHDEVNRRIAKWFDCELLDWPIPQIEYDNKENCYKSYTDYIMKKIKEGIFDIDKIVKTPLHPDHQVFVSNSIDVVNSVDQIKTDKKCILYKDSGKIEYHCSEAQARTIEQILTSILFIYEHVYSKGESIIPMGENQKQFISDWESEKYRKALNQI